MKRPFTMMMLGFGLVLVFSNAGVGGGASFSCPSDQPVAVAIAADLSLTGDQAIGKTNPGVLPMIQTTAGVTNGKGNYRLMDVTTETAEPDDEPWVKSAWKDLGGDKLKPGTWTAAGPRGGWKPKALPTKAEDAQAQLKRIMK